MGTRFLPITKSVPKEMLPIVDVPLVQFLLEEAKEQALKAHGIRVVERLPLVIKPNKFNKRYLETKRARMAHKL